MRGFESGRGVALDRTCRVCTSGTSIDDMYSSSLLVQTKYSAIRHTQRYFTIHRNNRTIDLVLDSRAIRV